MVDLGPYELVCLKPSGELDCWERDFASLHESPEALGRASLAHTDEHGEVGRIAWQRIDGRQLSAEDMAVASAHEEATRDSSRSLEDHLAEQRGLFAGTGPTDCLERAFLPLGV